MLHQSLLFLPFIFTILTMTMANPCPCELIVNESLSNNPPTSMTDSSTNQFVDDEILEDYLDQLTATSSDNLQDLSAFYPLLRQAKSLEANRKRFKRPSWATVGKREAIFNNKRPSWAPVG